MELHEALTQIAEIRRQVAKSDVFRGYRSAPVAFSGFVALAAAVAQPQVGAEPGESPWAYVALWVAAAMVSVLAVAIEMTFRLRLIGERTHFEITRLAIEQFLPSVAAGVLLTAVVVRYMPAQLSLLPGLWQMLFALGIFASARLLPRPIFAVGAFYLTSAVLVLIWARDGSSLAPWSMGVPFAIGQLAAAAILYWTLERRR